MVVNGIKDKAPPGPHIDNGDVPCDGERVEVEVQVEDNRPVVSALYWMAPGEIWVLNSRGGHDQEPGIMQTFDVFDTTGVFLREVAIACEGDPDEDKLIFLENGRAALVCGAAQARRNTFGGSRGEEEEVAKTAGHAHHHAGGREVGSVEIIQGSLQLGCKIGVR